MLNKKDIDYFNFGKLENEKFWRRLGGKPVLKDKNILDFGCGHGALCVDMAKNGARHITGIDLEDNLISFANENLNNNYDYLLNKISFEKRDIIKDNLEKKYDLIVSKDTFEHTLNLPQVLDEMYNLLNVGGKAYIGFGPLYNFYNGDHGRTEMILPWFHLIFSEKFIIDRLNKKKQNQISHIQELGLSKYSLKEYENIFNNSKFKLNYFKTNLSDHPVSFLFDLLSKISLLREYCTYNIYCILEK